MTERTLREKIEALEIWQGDDGRTSLVSLASVLAILDAHTEQPAPDTKGAKGKKKKLHGIEVEHTATGWAVMRKFSADYKEQLAICPNPVAAEEIAAALRPQPAPSAAPTDNTALVEGMRRAALICRTRGHDTDLATRHILADAIEEAALASREAKPAPDAVGEAVDSLPLGHVVIEQADMLDGRVSQTVEDALGNEYQRIVHADEA